MTRYTMYKTSSCGACKMVEASGVIDDLKIKVINIEQYPLLKPKDMQGAPFFTKVWLTEGGSVHTVTHTGYANKEMLENL